jgi:hypothetical protein
MDNSEFILPGYESLSNEYNELSSSLSDYSKDVWGTRTRRGCASQFSTEEELLAGILSVRQEIAQLDAIAPSIWAQEQQQQQLCIQMLEQRIQAAMDLAQGSSREDAIRWIADAEDCSTDLQHLEWHLGIPFGYITGTLPGYRAA